LPVIRTQVIHLRHLPLEIHFLLGGHLLVCPLHVPLMLPQEASKEVMAILMGAFLSALSSIWLFSVHGVGILTSSTPPSENCSFRMHLFATFPIFDTGTPFHQSSVFSSLLVCHPKFFSSLFTKCSRMGSAALCLRDIPPGYACHSPSLPPLQSAY
jgi:hypothetical protein